MKSVDRNFLRSVLSACLVTGVLTYSVEAFAAKQVTYYYTDPQGTVLAETDAQGNITRQYDYTPYGREVMGTPEAKPGFTGHMTDPDTGLVYMKARYYDPDVGRFLSVDVYKASAGDPFSTNLYVYAHATPSVLIDPDGRQAKGGKDMEICDGPVPCDQNVSLGRGSFSGNSYEKVISRVFQNYQAVGNSSVQATDTMPEELKTALYYIIGSPQGKLLVEESLRSGESIGLAQVPSSLSPTFHFDHGSGLVMYTLQLAEYKARVMNSPTLAAEVKDQTLDVILMHEIAHSPLGRRAFGITSTPATQSDEFEDVRKVENPYRSFYGIPARTTYSGVAIP